MLSLSLGLLSDLRSPCEKESHLFYLTVSDTVSGSGGSSEQLAFSVLTPVFVRQHAFAPIDKVSTGHWGPRTDCPLHRLRGIFF